MDEAILYDNGKVDPAVFDASADDRERGAFLGLLEVPDAREVFEFGRRVGDARDRVQRLEEALEPEDGGQVWASAPPKRAKPVSAGEAGSGLDDAECELEKLEAYGELHEEAREGGADATRQRLEVANR